MWTSRPIVRNKFKNFSRIFKNFFRIFKNFKNYFLKNLNPNQNSRSVMGNNTSVITENKVLRGNPFIYFHEFLKNCTLSRIIVIALP